MSALLSLEGVTVELQGSEALCGVSLEVGAGESLGLVGETGCGKSLTCRVVTGLLGRVGGKVTAGRARFDGENLLADDSESWKRIRGHRIALVPQGSLSGLDPVMRVGGQLEETVAVLDPEADPAARALELLEHVRLPRPSEVVRRYPHELSGGMRQRVMIALALAGHPSLLVADEPTTALDVTVQRSILDLLAELRRETGMAMLFVTHDLGVVESVTDRVAIMYAGSVIESGRTQEVLDRPGHPYTKALVAAVPSRGRRGEPLTTISGAPPGLGQCPRGCPFEPRCAFAIDRCQVVEPELKQLAGSQRVRCIRAEELRGVATAATSEAGSR